MSPTALMSPLRRGVFEEVPQTLSSWDSCMAKSYCKYPVIVGIVVGSLVLFATLWCMFRCICCGAKCCCCGCGSKKPKPSKFADGPGSSPFHRSGPGGPPAQGFQPSPAPPVYEAPQFATFDASGNGKVNDDALPPMPSWDNATTRRVEDTSAPTQDVELGRLDSTGQSYNGGGNGAIAPGGKTGRGGYSEVPSNPGSPVPGSRPTPTPGSGYRGTEAPSYFSQSQGTTTAYDGASTAPGHDYAYGGSHTPNPNQQNPYAYRSNSPYDQRIASPSVYDNGSAYRGHTTASPPPPQRIYSPEQSYSHTPQPYQTTQHQQYPPQSGYRGYSPSVPSHSPPPQQHGYQNNPYDMGFDRSGTPASMQAGRKPAPNTWRDV
ncbi:hypothetical protein FQN54_007013 [Arachnomyces sp. PD_36]|nr:hypothetical protein FQN54_007013 [Arachnomyces sp. PD_36]